MDVDIETEIRKKYLAHAIRLGVVDVNGRTDQQIADEYGEHLSRIGDLPDSAFELTICHLDDLLRRARDEVKLGNVDMACVFYATWIEHKLNDLIIALLFRGELRVSENSRMLRLAMEDKITWLVPALGGTELPSDAISDIRAVAQRRNEFLHYKWRAAPDDERDTRANKKLLARAETMVSSVSAIDRDSIPSISDDRIATIIDLVYPDASPD